jgi:dTDP-4-dehydrorhamnose reductase
MTAWLITGAGGMLGHDVVEALKPSGDRVVALTKTELDVTNAEAVVAAVREHHPDVIVNCAAFTKVDDCETNEELATAINGTALRHLADAANESGALLVQVSTDFVFDGKSTTPYQPSHPVEPLSAYGRSKLDGEMWSQRAVKHLIVRTSWLFGSHGWNFVEAMRKQVENGRFELKVVDDQRGKPTYTPHLAEAIVRLSRLALTHGGARGTFHYADDDEATWFDFATEIMAALDRRGLLPQPVKVNRCSTDEFPRPARRPAYSVLSTDLYTRVTGEKPRSWREGLEKYLG